MRILMVLACLLIPSICFADCNDLASNEAWMTGIETLKKQNEAKQFNEAIETSKTLFAICQDSPALLYYTGIALRGTGDNDRATIYFQKASEATSKMTVEPGIGRLIWYARYEAENPERTQDSFDKLTAELNDQKTLNQELVNLNQELVNQQSTKALENSYQDMIALDRYKAVMWSGVGIGAAGVVLAAVGGALVGTQDKSNMSEASTNENLKLNGSYLAGWTSLGIGIGLAVAGATMAGIGGYYITHTGSTEKPSDGADLSFHFGLGNVGFSF